MIRSSRGLRIAGSAAILLGLTAAPAIAGTTAGTAAGTTAGTAAGTTAGTAAAAAPTPGYVTLLFGRAQWQTVADCKPIKSSTGATVTLGTVAKALWNLHKISGTGAIVVDNVQDTTRYCEKNVLQYPSWQDYKNLRNAYGWHYISAGFHNDIRSLPRAQQVAMSCGTIPTINNKIAGPGGDVGASGLFAYASNRWSVEVQRDVVSNCFSYGRQYHTAINNRAGMHAPWFQWTMSVNGGRCNDASLPCYTMAAAHRYDSPDKIAAMLKPGENQWSVVQIYRFVTGTKTTGGGPDWDCTSSDWTKHWTDQDELYCWNDVLKAVKQIPKTVNVVDPATVAAAWGRAK